MPSTTIRGKRVRLPIFCPDATRAVLRAVDAADTLGAGVQGLIVNTYHLMANPGVEVLKKSGGIHSFMNWPGLTISDSGGFQVFSLIHRKIGWGKITDEGVVFKEKGTHYAMTPESCIQTQFAIGADVLICLDDCPPQTLSESDMIRSVDRTLAWAQRCRIEYDKQIKARKLTERTRPLLFAVVQGGNYLAQRTRCAQELVKIGFDGFGFGGWPMGEDGKLNRPALKAVADATKTSKFRYALGVGDPHSCVECVELGYNIFDCVLPTRDARHGRLYVWKSDPALFDCHPGQDAILDPRSQFFQYLRIDKSEYEADQQPISPHCDCLACTNYSRAYLRHLFKIGDTLAFRLATIHNLRFYAQLFEKLQTI